MLMIFNLDWPSISISEQVFVANRGMRRLAEAVGLCDKVIYNCGSMGACERVLPFSNPEKAATSDELNYLRWHLKIARDELAENPIFRLNHETREMIGALKTAGHSLAAVWAGATQKLETGLEGARCRDAFGEAVFGYDRLPKSTTKDYTSVRLCREAARASQADLHDSIIVADSPEGVEEGKNVGTRAVVGYVPSAEPEAKKTHHIAELEEAGADYTLIGGYCVATLPALFTTLSDHQARQQMKSILSDLNKRSPS